MENLTHRFSNALPSMSLRESGVTTTSEHSLQYTSDADIENNDQLFEEILDELSLEETNTHPHMTEIERQNILEELRARPPCAVKPHFEVKHSVRLQEDLPECGAEFDEVIVAAADDAPFPSGWHERKHFEVPSKISPAGNKGLTVPSGDRSDTQNTKQNDLSLPSI